MSFHFCSHSWEVQDVADGTVVKPKKQELVEVPSNTRAQKLVADTRKRIADLPAPPQSMNAVGVEFCVTAASNWMMTCPSVCVSVSVWLSAR